MEVAQVVLAKQPERPGGLNPGRAERIAAQFRPLDHPHPGEAADLRAVALVARPDQGGHGLAVSAGQFLDHPAGERIFPADDEMIAAGRDQGDGGHCVILTGPGRPSPQPASRAGKTAVAIRQVLVAPAAHGVFSG